jgi:hypothetical protein
MSAVNFDDKPALVLIDLQKGIFGRPTAVPTDEMKRLGMRSAAAFPARGLPVVGVTVAGSGRSQPGTRSSRRSRPDSDRSLPATT